ncbi:hypothetical protein [Arcanobacterium phocae]|uniref:hypothetical protein n=2 Tax=Arcanobacterium phocae TaxID=131112 RepID=UPI001C0EDEBE|nr:hypothetical protein [Arcanobacterium phocae]
MMPWWIFAVTCVMTVVIVSAVLITSQARRLDALHKKILKSRAALDNALIVRAHAAMTVAQSGVLDLAGSVVLTNAAQECADAAEYDLVEDGLNRNADDEVSPKSYRALDIDRLAIESELSRVLRYTVDELEEDEKNGYSEILGHLQQVRQSVRLTRRFHNIHVAGAQRIRRSALAQVFRIHGYALWPQTVDLDDE